MPVEPITHLEKSTAGTVEPVTHLEKSIAGTVEPVTHLEKIIDQYGSGGALPALTDPALPSDVLSGKEYLNGSGAKQTGTLVAYSANDWLDVTKPVGVVTSTAAFPNATNASSLLAYRSGVTEVRLPNAGCIPDSIFIDCKGLEKVFAPNAIFVGASGFFRCSKLQTAVFPKMKYLYSSAFQYCTNLESADFGGTPESGQGLWRALIFDGDTKFGALVLRSSAVWALSNTNVFSGTKFASGKAGGTLYVPAALISDYQAATNWATILGYPNNQIKSIESTATDPDAPVDLTMHYIDGTLIPST